MSDPYSPPDRQKTPGVPAKAAQEIRTLQIITFGMVMGVFAFMGVCLVMNEAAFSMEPELLSWVAIGFAGLMFVNHLVIPNLVAKQALKSVSSDDIRNADDAKKFELIFPVFRSRHIVACALLEGAAFFNLIGYMVTEYAGNLGAAVVLVLFILARLPGSTAATFWIQDRAREIEMSY